jgi:hypothetical protein
MGYELLGFFVWQRTKLRWRRRARAAAGKAAIAGAAVSLIVGAVAIAERRSPARPSA